MYRSRSLIVLLNARRVLTAPRQVVSRYMTVEYGSLSKRQFSDSVKVMVDLNENNEKTGSDSASKKLFSVDDILPEGVENHEKNNSIESNAQLEPTIEFFKEKEVQKEVTEPEKAEVVESREKSTAENDLTETISSTPREQEESVKSGDKRVTEEENKTEYQTPRFIMTYISLINSLYTPEKVLQTLKSIFQKNISHRHKTSVIVCALNRLQLLKFHEIDASVEKLLQDHLEFKSQICVMDTSSLLHILNFFMKSESDHVIADMILHEMCWRGRKSSLSETLNIMKLVKNKKLTTEKRREVYKVGQNRLGELIEKVDNAADLLTIMYLIDGKDLVWSKVEQEALLLLHSMDRVQTYKLIHQLAVARSKDSLLVSKAVRQLCSRPIILDFQKFGNLLYACGVLKIHDDGLLNEVSTNLVEMIKRGEEVNDRVYKSLLSSCSKCSWNHRNLINVIMKGLSETSISDMKDIDLVQAVISLGHLNLVQHGDLALTMTENIGSESSPTDMLNAVYSLACLQKCQPELVTETLSPDFFSILDDHLKGKPAYVQENVLKKLLHLYGYLKEETGETNAEIEKQASFWRAELKKRPAPLVGLARAASSALSELAPLGKYTNINVMTDYGYVIDFEIFVDKSLKAVKLDSSKGMQKVWIKMLDFNAFLRGNEEPEYTGDTAMMLRHLKSVKDAVIVYVSYKEWSKFDKKIDHMYYLETQISRAIFPEEKSKRSEEREEYERLEKEEEKKVLERLEQRLAEKEMVERIVEKSKLESLEEKENKESLEEKENMESLEEKENMVSLEEKKNIESLEEKEEEKLESLKEKGELENKEEPKKETGVKS